MGNPIGKAVGGEIMQEFLLPIFRTFSGDASRLAKKGSKLNYIDSTFKKGMENGSLFNLTNELQQSDALRVNRKIANNLDEYTKFKSVMGEAAVNGNYTPLTGYLSQLEVDDAAKARIPQVQGQPGLAVNTRAGESPRYDTPVDPIATGKANRMGTGGKVSNTDIANIGRTEAEFADFKKAKGESIYGPGAHHHIVDQEFTGKALNRQDAEQIVQEQKKLGGSRFGDSELNVSMAMDRKELPRDINFRQSGKEDMAAQLSQATELKGRAAEVGTWVPEVDRLNQEQRRLLTDLTKGDTEIAEELYYPAKIQDPASIGLPRGDKTARGFKLPKKFPTDWPDAALAGQPITPEIKDKFWKNRWKYNGLDRKNIKFNPKGQIVSSDHIDIIHAALDSPQFKIKRQIEEEIKSGEWLTRTAKEAAKMLNEVQRISQNIMLNVNKRRLKLVKAKIRETLNPAQAQFYLQDPYNIKQWIEENPALAANLGWGKWNPKFSELAKDPGVITDELRIVFITKVRKPVDLLNFQQGFSSTVQTPQ